MPENRSLIGLVHRAQELSDQAVSVEVAHVTNDGSESRGWEITLTWYRQGLQSDVTPRCGTLADAVEIAHRIADQAMA